MTEKRSADEIAREEGWSAGYEEAEKALARQAAAQEAAKTWVGRFWIPPDPSNEVRITFVDDDTKPSEALLGMRPPYQLFEHQMYLNGHWRNWFTCLGKGKCPLCDAGERPYFAAVYTIIDHGEWTDKQGRVHKDELKLFVAKGETLRLMQHISKKRGGLRGLVLDVTRTASDTSPNVGSQFDFVERAELDVKVQPLDYRKLLARKPAEDLLKLVGAKQAEEDEISF